MAVADPPPTIAVGVKVRLDSAAGVTDNDAVFVPPHTAEMPVEADAETGCVVTENCTGIAFAGTVTVAGTVAAAVFDELSATGTPPAGAFAVKVTVPLTFTPHLEVRPGTIVNLEASLTPSSADAR